MLKGKDKDNEALAHELNTIIPGEEQAIKYLITFREDLVSFLETSKFLEGKLDVKFDQMK